MDPQDTGNPGAGEIDAGKEALPPVNGDGGGWRGDVAPELRRVAEKFTSPGEVVKSYAELEKKLGNAISIPGDGASNEDIDAFHRRLGRPDTPADYTVRLPDDLPDILRPTADSDARTDRFLGLAHELGLSNDQVENVIDWYYRDMTEQVSAMSHRDDETAAEQESALRGEWGTDYESNLDFGRRATEAFGDENSIGDLEKIIGRPSVLRMMARIGRRMGEAGDAAGGLGETRRKTLEQELGGLMEKKDYWQNEAVQTRVREINVELHGSGPIVGTANRNV